MRRCKKKTEELLRNVVTLFFWEEQMRFVKGKEAERIVKRRLTDGVDKEEDGGTPDGISGRKAVSRLII